jgi:hypothetical protein
MMHIKILGKQNKPNSEETDGKIIYIRTEINEMEIKKTI